MGVQEWMWWRGSSGVIGQRQLLVSGRSLFVFCRSFVMWTCVVCVSFLFIDVYSAHESHTFSLVLSWKKEKKESLTGHDWLIMKLVSDLLTTDFIRSVLFGQIVLEHKRTCSNFWFCVMNDKKHQKWLSLSQIPRKAELDTIWCWLLTLW